MMNGPDIPILARVRDNKKYIINQGEISNNTKTKDTPSVKSQQG